MADDILKLDLYEIIGVTSSANESEIKKAYRKKALSCHPDKNPDNPKAAELFLQLSKALEILTDASAKAAYDKVINAREQAKLRSRELDAKRRKLKDDLEAREEAFRRTQSKDYVSTKTDEEKLKAEIERLSKEGSRLVEEEKERLRKKIIEDLQSAHTYSDAECRVKIRWRAAADDESNGGYNYDNLHKILLKHGEISVLVVSANKKGRGLVEYKTREAAESAINYEVGLVTNPLKFEGMWEKVKGAQNVQSNSSQLFNSEPHRQSGKSLFPVAGGSNNTKKSAVPQGLTCSSAPDIFNFKMNTDTTSTGPKTDNDLEQMVLNNLKRAEERKRLIEQMQAEDEGT